MVHGVVDEIAKNHRNYFKYPIESVNDEVMLLSLNGKMGFPKHKHQQIVHFHVIAINNKSERYSIPLLSEMLHQTIKMIAHDFIIADSS